MLLQETQLLLLVSLNVGSSSRIVVCRTTDEKHKANVGDTSPNTLALWFYGSWPSAHNGLLVLVHFVKVPENHGMDNRVKPSIRLVAGPSKIAMAGEWNG